MKIRIAYEDEGQTKECEIQNCTHILCEACDAVLFDCRERKEQKDITFSKLISTGNLRKKYKEFPVGSIGSLIHHAFKGTVKKWQKLRPFIFKKNNNYFVVEDDFIRTMYEIHRMSK